MNSGKNAPELLLCDVGNTNIKLGLADRESLLATFSLPRMDMETEDSLGLKILALLDHLSVQADSLLACVISSVVPALDPLLREAIARYLHCPAFFVPRDLPVPMENRYPRPQETGADRLVAAYAARVLFPRTASLLVVDFGTAVTFDCINENSYLGGLIFPGPGIALKALSQKTAKLPAIGLELDSSEPRPCQDTATSIQHGLVFGYKYLVEGLCGRLTDSLPGPVKIIATGSFALTLAKICDIFDTIRPSLVLDGLRNLYYTQIRATR